MSVKNALPLVSVICVCYNHAAFLAACLESVLAQTYPAIEIIAVDDASTDESMNILQTFVRQHTDIQLVALPVNCGNCAAFNAGLRLAKGEYVIDLATDDVLLPKRIARQVAVFGKLDESYGVVFTDAHYIDEKSCFLETHLLRNPEGELREVVPQGDIYLHILDRSHRICTPTMMMRKSVLDELGGYDKSLSYEDFDFWVRSARHYRYYYLDEVLTLKRVVRNSHSMGFYRTGHNPHLVSTLQVCRKARELNRTPAENEALARTVRYQLRLSFYTQNFNLVTDFAALLRQLQPLTLMDRVILLLSKVHFPVNRLYRLYFRWRYRFHK